MRKIWMHRKVELFINDVFSSYDTTTTTITNVSILRCELKCAGQLGLGEWLRQHSVGPTGDELGDVFRKGIARHSCSNQS